MINFRIIALEERIVLDAAAASVIYVNINNTSSVHDGTNWAHAYNNLQDALAKAAITPGPDPPHFDLPQWENNTDSPHWEDPNYIIYD